MSMLRLGVGCVGVLVSAVFMLVLLAALTRTVAWLAGANPEESLTESWVDAMYLGVLMVAWVALMSHL